MGASLAGKQEHVRKWSESRSSTPAHWAPGPGGRAAWGRNSHRENIFFPHKSGITFSDAVGCSSLNDAPSRKQPAIPSWSFPAGNWARRPQWPSSLVKELMKKESCFDPFLRSFWGAEPAFLSFMSWLLLHGKWEAKGRVYWRPIITFGIWVLTSLTNRYFIPKTFSSYCRALKAILYLWYFLVHLIFPPTRQWNVNEIFFLL